MKKYEHHLITPQQITLVFNEGHPISVAKDDAKYAKILQLLQTKQYDEVAYLVDKAAQINEHTKGKFLVRNGIVHVHNEALPVELSDKLLELVDAKEDTNPLEKFWGNLKKNPSMDSRKDLFAFLRANKIPITPNGCFIAYKKVRSNWRDCHTNTLNNRPGSIVKMERGEVDANRQNTCSTGLHVAAYSYASTFSDGHLVEVEVNPRDVVSVPIDYAQQKMRVCRYRVIRICEGEINDLIYRREQAKLY